MACRAWLDHILERALSSYQYHIFFELTKFMNQSSQ